VKPESYFAFPRKGLFQRNVFHETEKQHHHIVTVR
jgi:hypothetical protein